MNGLSIASRTPKRETSIRCFEMNNLKKKRAEQFKEIFCCLNIWVAKQHSLEAVVRMCSVKKVFLKISQNSQAASDSRFT